MKAAFEIQAAFAEVPAAAIDADPAATMRELYDRIGHLEQSLEDQQSQDRADWRSTLTRLLAVSDAITATAERGGLTTNAREATLIRDILGAGKLLLQTLRQQGVQPIAVIGEPVDPETTDIVGQEPSATSPTGLVLREKQIGYTWPYGVLRRAQVIVASEMPANVDSDATQA